MTSKIELQPEGKDFSAAMPSGPYDYRIYENAATAPERLEQGLRVNAQIKRERLIPVLPDQQSTG